MYKQYNLTLIKNPSGTFSFVGKVPYELAFVAKNGGKISSDEVESQLMLPASYRSIKSRVFTSEVEALHEAEKLGLKIEVLT